MSLSRSARRHSQISLGLDRRHGCRPRRLDSRLLGLYLAAMAALSVGFFGLLLLFD